MNTGIGLITELGATFRNRSGIPGTGSALRISRRGSAIGVHDNVIVAARRHQEDWGGGFML